MRRSVIDDSIVKQWKHEAAEEECGLQIQLEEDEDGSRRQSCLESSGTWHMLHWERHGVSLHIQVFVVVVVVVCVRLM